MKKSQKNSSKKSAILKNKQGPILFYDYNWVKTLLNNMSDPVFVNYFNENGPGKYIDVNKAAEVYLGYTRAKLLKMTSLELNSIFRIQDFPLFSKETMEDLLSTGSTKFQTIHQSINRKKIPVEVNAFLFELKGKRAVLSIVKNIAKRISAKHIFDLSESHYKTFIENSFDGIYRLEVSPPISTKTPPRTQFKQLLTRGYIDECNIVFAKMYGENEEKNIVGKKVYEFYGVESDKNNEEVNLNFIKNNYQLKNFTTKEYDKDGNIKYFSNNSFGVIENNKLVRIWGTQSDITEKVIVETALIESEDRFRSIFENAPFGIYYFDRKGIITSCNQLFATISGTAKEKLIGHNIFGGKKNTKVKQAVRQMFKSGTGKFEGNYETMVSNKKIAIRVLYRGIKDINGKIISGVGMVEDVGDKFRIEQELIESESRYRTIFNGSSDAVFIHEPVSGKLKDVNEKALEFYKCTYEEMIKSDPFQFSENIPPYRAKDALEFIHKAFTKPQIFEWHAKDKKGRLFWVEINMRKANIAGSDAIFAAVRDIDERKKTEEQLLESETRYRMLVESLADPVVVHSEGKLVFVNEAAVKLANVSDKNDLIGKPIMPFVHPDYRLQAIERINSPSKILPVIEEKFIIPNGQIINVEVGGVKILYEGKPAIQNVIRDVTERKRQEQVQKALFDVSQAVVKSSNLKELFINIHDIVKGLMLADNFYIALYDKEKNEISFPYFVDQYDLPPKTRKMGKGFTEYVIRQGKSLVIDSKRDMDLRKKGEVELIGELSKTWLGVVLKHKNEVIGVLTLQDYENPDTYSDEDKHILGFVSEQIAQAIIKLKTEEENLKYLSELRDAKEELENKANELSKVNTELRLSEIQLKELNANKDKFFTIISHDLRSPFSALMGYSQLLTENFDSLETDELKLSLDSLRRTAQNIYALLNGLLDWAQTQTGKVEFNPASYKLKTIVAVVLSLVKANADNKKIKLENKISQDFRVYVDRSMLETILRNLLSNAIKFTHEKGKVVLSAKQIDNDIQISVKDNGTGIEKDDLQKLFKIEDHVSTAGTNNEVGTGVGLILCKELIEKNSGKIWVTSEVEKGSEFTFSLITKKSKS